MKHLEIERKFLVRQHIWEDVEKPEAKKLVQGYLCRDDQGVVRVRIADDKGFLTIKGKLENLGRPEFEYGIPIDEATDLLALTLFTPIEKTRYKYMYRGKLWDVDIFHGANEGLFMAEVELEDPEEQIDFPDWIGEEVSHDPRYYNAYLSQHPFKTWSENRKEV
ncbi:MAG: CYTH domain-containing protein [Bacteroidales bacterium]|nr:CYTH domain-containing protein [Bacteroidales bacterium]